MVGIVDDVITAVTGKTPGTVVREKIFEPLGMKRSCTKSADFPGDGNIARGYQVMVDGTPFPMVY